MGMAVRRATTAEIDRVGDVLARAFLDDPVSKLGQVERAGPAAAQPIAVCDEHADRRGQGRGVDHKVSGAAPWAAPGR